MGLQPATIQPVLEAMMENSEAGHYVSVAENGNDTGNAPSGEGCLWPASFILCNIRGLVGMRAKNKSPFLHDLATSSNCLWLAVTETWIDPGTLDSKLLVHMPRYSVMRQDRLGRQRGWFLPLPKGRTHWRGAVGLQ